MLKGLYYSLLLALLCISSQAQPIQYRDQVFNDILFRFNVDGNLFENSEDRRAACFIPAQGNSSPIYASALWLMLKKSNDTLMSLTPSYAGAPKGFLPGPGSTSYNSAYYEHYYNAWYMSKDLIDQHRSTYMLPGYSPIPEIFNWPANGIGGELGFLAPFFDLNQNGIYDPQNGDYPLIPGDLCLYFMQNTLDPNCTKPNQGESFKIQIRGFLYAFSNATYQLDHTLFCKYIVTNNSQDTYENLYAAQWLDPDIGNQNDDAGGCDTLLNLSYAYNSDNIDDANSNSYGMNPPALGFMWLNSPMVHSTVYNSGFPAEPFPQVSRYYELMSGIKPDGSVDSSQFDYPGNPDIWAPRTEMENGYENGDRRLLSSTLIPKLLPGSNLCLDGAYMWTRIGQNNFDQVQALKQGATEIQDFYNTYLHGSCYRLSVGIQNNQSTTNQPYPNPCENRLWIGKNYTGNGRLKDLSGRELIHFQNRAYLDLQGLAPGTYLLYLDDLQSPFIIQHY